MKLCLCLIIYISILLGTCDVFADNSLTLCSNGDHVYFTCQTRNKKIISLCGKGSAERPEYIYYRFGKDNDKIDMEYPAEKDKTSYQKFSYNHYFRYQTSYFSITFRNGDYVYFIYDNNIADKSDEKPDLSSGINVTKDGQSDYQVNIPCISGAKSKLYPLSSLLACDEDVNGLGCTNK